MKTTKMTCIADETRLFQMFENLMKNALFYAKTTISIEARITGDMVEVIISDDGVGIHSTELPFIFDRFYKKDNKALGLA